MNIYSQSDAPQLNLFTVIKFYVINRCICGLIRTLGIFPPPHKARKIWINEHLFIRPGKASDFKFFFSQVQFAEKEGSFNKSLANNLTMIREGYYRQHLMSVKLHRMPFPNHPLSPAIFVTGIYDGQRAGFIWLKEFQGFPFNGWEIYLLSVDEKFRNSGIADSLIKYAINYIELHIAQDIYVRIKKSRHSQTMYHILGLNGFAHFKALHSESGAKIYFRPHRNFLKREC